MGIFDSTEPEEQDFEEKETNGQASSAPIIALIGLLFWPSLVFGYLFYALFRFVRLRFSVIACIVSIFELVVVVTIIATKPFDTILKVVSNASEISSSWTNLIQPLLLINMLIGGLLGLVFVTLETRRMRKNPHLLQLPGTWMYNFEYRRTPKEILTRKRMVDNLKSGKLVSPKLTPLGITEEGEYRVVSRYMSEAAKHTLIVGGSGSGKPLLGTTEVPTPNGFVFIKDLKVGDYVYDENGKPTEVVGVYNPQVSKAYRMFFKDGAEIVAGDEHLWRISLSNLQKTVSTEDIFNLLSEGRGCSIDYVTGPTALGNFEEIHDPLTLGRALRDGVIAAHEVPESLYFSSTQSKIKFIYGALDHDLLSPNDVRKTIAFNTFEAARAAKTVVASIGWWTSAIHDFYGRFAFDFMSLCNTLDLIEENDKECFENCVVNSGEFRHVIERLEEIPVVGDEFYCITVDSEAHLFLVTRDYIATRNTITMQSMILANISTRIPTFIVDMKRSPEFASRVASWTKDADGDFYHFVNGDPEDYDIADSPGQASYDPLKSGSPVAKADMILGVREYDTASAVYKSSMNQLLQVLFAMLRYADWKKTERTYLLDTRTNRTIRNRDDFCRDNGISSEKYKTMFEEGVIKEVRRYCIDWEAGGIYQLASALREDNITTLVEACQGSPIYVEATEILEQSRGKTQISHAISELRGQMRTITASEYGKWLKTPKNGSRNIDLLRLSQKPGSVVMFSLNSDSEPEFAKFIGTIIMSNLASVSSKRREKQVKNPVSVYIDEFQVLNPESVSGLLEKARESRIAMTLAQQSFEQIVKSATSNGEAYLLSVLDTCSNFIIHAGMTEDSAERLSKILGKKWVTGYRTTSKHKSFFGSFNRKNKKNQNLQTFREEVWVFEPAKFMNLSSPDENNNNKSTAVIVNKTSSDPIFKGQPGAVARVAWMIPDDRVLKDYYVPTFDKDDDDFRTPVKQSVERAVNLKKSRQVIQVEDDYTSDDVFEPIEADSFGEESPQNFNDKLDFESVEDTQPQSDYDDDDDDLISLGEGLEETVPVREEPSRRAPVRAEERLERKSSFEAIMHEGALPEMPTAPRTRKERVGLPTGSEEKQKKPRPPASRKTKKEESSSEMSLPDLSELGLE